MRKQLFATFALVALITVALSSAADALGAVARQPSADNPDFTQGGQIPEGATHDWNLGPIGARGWMYSNQLETSEARQVYITQVEAGSPADGLLEVGDVLLGVRGRAFEYDPRTEIGKAISDAEASGGRLSLTRWRDGRTQRIVVRLPVLGRYSRTAPINCRKSQRIFEDGCLALARRMESNPSQGTPIERCYNALALLASGEEKYLPIVRRQVEMVKDFSDLERRDLHSWWYGPINILLAEYTLATGDKRFMGDLERITMEIVNGQSPIGSWGHRFVQQHNGRLAGYGMLNATGLPLTVSLILARKAGVEHAKLDEAIEKSARLIRFYVGKGSVPYGDHHPWIENHDDNGKNGIAAIMFNLLGDAEAAEYFSRLSVACHGSERDTGHTGNYFNMLWAMPGVALSGPNAAGAWMEEFGWYYDFTRRWDGTFRHQGPPDRRPDSYHNWDATGAYLLAYAQPLKKIYITGRQDSLAEQVCVAEAERLIEDGRGWSPRVKLARYAERSDGQIMSGLRSWSPVVRERSAIELARRDGDPTRQLMTMLRDDDLHTRLGACQACIMLKGRAAPAVPALLRLLSADDLWLRIKAGEALAAIGDAAMPVLPELLRMVVEYDASQDPRGMQQRYLSFALFDPREGMLRRSLDNVDQESLRAAIKAGLRNQDGRARGTIGSIYNRLSYEHIKPLLPAIYEAVVEPAPSGIMFADQVRLHGLEILAKNRIAEGLPECISLIEPGRWGMNDRIKRCLDILRMYGGAAKPEIPRLRELERQLAAEGWQHDRIAALGIDQLIADIEADDDPPTLRSLTHAGS